MRLLAGSGMRWAGPAAVAIAALGLPSLAVAQDWQVYGGVAARAEYNDNYFFTASGQTSGNPALSDSKESAYTVTVSPFLAASRRTEVSALTALLSIGGNKVWGPSPSEDYVSGSFVLDGTLRELRSSWAGRASYARSSSLENVVRESEVLLVRTYTDAAALTGSYSYALTDRSTIGATIGGFANSYESVEGGDNASDDSGYNVAGTFRYSFSDRTELNYSLGFSYYKSDFTRSDVVTTTLGVVHRYSPQLTVSASAGGYWSDTTSRQDLPGQGVPVTAGETRSDNGHFFGGSIGYAISEHTKFDFSLSERLAPSGTGTISRSDDASVTLSHQFSERLTGRVGASYARTSFPAALDSSYTDKTLQGQVGLSYQLQEHWILEAGYQYTRARYSRDAFEPESNLVFVSVAYNWPGSSYTSWLGRPADTQVLPGAGPLSLPAVSPALPGAPSSSLPPEVSPFEPFTLP